MTDFQALCIGCFILSAAHYVRDGESFWYAAWLFSATVMLAIGKLVVRRAISSPQGTDR